jgi:hypothetical protein
MTITNLNRTKINVSGSFVIPTLYVKISSIIIHNLQVHGRYDDVWVGKFCQEIIVLLKTKVKLSKNYVFPRRKGLDKSQSFSHDEIEV